jgi:predicted DsbA family dithiol-disulfide isomerase
MPRATPEGICVRLRAMPRITRFILATLLVAPLACKKADRAGSAGATGAPTEAARDPKRPVAKVGDEVITEADLEAKIKPRLGRLEAEHAERVHGLKSQTLDELVETRLIEKKAKAEGLTADKLVEREVNSKIAEPQPAEMQALYDQAKASGRPLPPFEQVKGDITKHLKQQKSEGVRKAFMDKLRADHKVETMLPPLLMPRVQVAAVGPSKGDEKAPVTIVEFSDYECPYCSRAEEAVNKVMEAYKGKVRVVFRDFPLPFHQKANKAHEAALCAGDQNKYWDMHGKLFANQKALDVPQLKGYAKDIGLDTGKFDKCLDGGDKLKTVEENKKAGEEAGVSGTPAFFINGRPLSGAQPFEKFKELIDHELAQVGK